MTIDVPDRKNKPRRINGLTSVHDVGVPYDILKAILNDYAIFIDIAKFGIGTAYITPRLEDKIQLYKDNDIEPYFGGTLFEKYYAQRRFYKYLELLSNYSIRWIEVSTGTINLPIEDRLALIREIKEDYTVLAEVGSKDEQAVMSPSSWLDEINSLFQAGAKYVITEGRDSARAGLYRPSGEVRTGLVEDIKKYSEVDRLIFEAPTAASQNYLINSVGPNVNLGNINPNDVLQLETQRMGLKFETFYL